MNREKAKAAFEKMCKCSDPDLLESFWHIYLAGAEWASNDWEKSFNEVVGNLHEEYEKLQTELDWHKKELARLDHELVDACDRANKLQTDLKSVNFSYWKKCEEVNRLQQAVSEAREIFKDELVYCFPESNHWHGEIKKWLEKYGDNND